MRLRHDPRRKPLAMEAHAPPKPKNLLERAILNQYNYIFLGGAAMFTMATGSWLPAIIAAGAEVLWVVLGADSSVFRRWVQQQETSVLTGRPDFAVNAYRGFIGAPSCCCSSRPWCSARAQAMVRAMIVNRLLG